MVRPELLGLGEVDSVLGFVGGALVGIELKFHARLLDRNYTFLGVLVASVACLCMALLRELPHRQFLLGEHHGGPLDDVHDVLAGVGGDLLHLVGCAQ